MTRITADGLRACSLSRGGAIPKVGITKMVCTGIAYPGLFIVSPFRAKNDLSTILLIQSVISIGYSTRLSLCYVRRCDVAHA